MDLSEFYQSHGGIPPAKIPSETTKGELPPGEKSTNMVVKFRDVFSRKDFPFHKNWSLVWNMIPFVFPRNSTEFPPTNHGSVENGCISKISFHFLIN